MGLAEEDQKRSQDLRLQLNGKAVSEIIAAEPTQTSGACVSLSEGMVCCQANGGSPCHSPVMLEAEDRPQLREREAKLNAEKKSRKRQISRNNSIGKGVNTRRVYSTPTWFESLEIEDMYAGLAVIGAALSVAYAYSCYKQSR